MRKVLALKTNINKMSRISNKTYIMLENNSIHKIKLFCFLNFFAFLMSFLYYDLSIFFFFNKASFNFAYLEINSLPVQ